LYAANALKYSFSGRLELSYKTLTKSSSYFLGLVKIILLATKNFDISFNSIYRRVIRNFDLT
ncbi:MAG: hypothetical protein K6D97_06825, partial [Clostridia bacterium]|nr:hypothetical protein [Clostridia bacterium]